MLAPSYPPHAFPSGRILLAFAVLAALAGSLVTLAVARGWTHELDAALLLVLRGAPADLPPWGPGWFREAVRDLTALGSMLVLSMVVVVATALMLASGRYRLAALLLGSSLAATAYSTGLKLLFDRPRPDIVAHQMATFTSSFPSGHSLLSAAILLTNGGLLAFAARRTGESWVIGIAAILLTTLVGLSRIYLGVHWPSDVLAGWLFGTLWACLTLFLARSLSPLPKFYG